MPSTSTLVHDQNDRNDQNDASRHTEPPTPPSSSRRSLRQSTTSKRPKPSPQPHGPPPTRRLRAPKRRLYSIAFTWPDKRPFDGEKTDRNPPRWYADAVTAFITRAAADGSSSILINVHGALRRKAADGLVPLDALAKQWRAAFKEAVGHANLGGGSPSKLKAARESLRIVACDESDHPMLPTAMRAVPLFDPPESRGDVDDQTVICVDIHDSAVKQPGAIEALLAAMLDEGRSAGFTVWPGYDLRSSFDPRDAQLAPPPRIRVDRTVAEAEEGIVWHVDCGLLIALPPFRRLLRDLNLPSYAGHLRHCHDNFEYSATSGTDEMVLEMYALAGAPMGDARRSPELTSLVKANATVRVHTLYANPKERRPKCAWPTALREWRPAYAEPAKRPRKFIYDSEAKMHIAARASKPMKWVRIS